ncbi:hypothetical protein ACLESO_56545 [Pyxidicoccus sp. 3LG]
MSIRRTTASTRNATVSAMLDPALGSARDALQTFLEKALRAQFGADWQATLERDRLAQGGPRASVGTGAASATAWATSARRRRRAAAW